ncbi:MULTISPECIES: hypothetical protein [Acinetobacter]|nr:MULTISPECIES: hypothetical protein [Acinetobacter calcoaceticus/baumannii complex]MCF1296809.1 hypothetical protein [Acinetobacter nosocomialis]MCZ3104602.1 hypothetical protein [Acinetobacter baumannii]MCZ3370211.1 hypothetical protein [Acinetobacter baumannii]MDA3524617.1 hypothetical protein [Acinetobacter baumannii]MDA4985904.1 hypothetical protein [Acinetobacter baumannii]
MNLTDFKKRLLWGLGILFIFIVWITFPLIFKTWVFTLIVKPPFTPLEFASLGPIGDIFGGLTAFFTSLTLIIVLYSAYLQRQANKDAREAMSEQLKQAKEASAEQLKQAKESTRQQLELARDTHSSQIKETQYSIFSNIFYSLLNQKHERSRVIFFEKDEQKIDLYQMFEYVNAKIFSLVDNQWKDVSDITISDLKKEFDLLLVEKNKFSQSPNIYTYFLIYIDLFNLIRDSDLEENDKTFFKTVITNSMTIGEQLTFLWISAFTPILLDELKDTQVFDYFYHENLRSFVFKFHKKSHFRHAGFTEGWPN